MRKRIDILEEHDPNKALVGCYLDSSLRLRILVLTYYVGGRESSKAASCVSPCEVRIVRADDYTTTSTSKKRIFLGLYYVDKAHRQLEQNSFYSYSFSRT